ncbi:glyoxylate/hydroxypyruvate reductase HPR3-like [Quillaja saponaria]|uniref:Glyoxylate/hydroxypyruvate reductase HPR3-like n=1 Tax=Quillaja saponaria TaxID=32244 RepID=A0AAD7LSL2_QUISA|nr:glyoxylate/hydroxypyruvate reductase HPR3-like [Quillaja saponaria]
MFFAFFPQLNLLSPQVWVDHINLIECRRRGVQVAGAGSLFSEDVADMAVGLFIDVMRKISARDRYIRQRVQSGPWDFPLGSKEYNFLLIMFAFLFHEVKLTLAAFLIRTQDTLCLQFNYRPIK